MSVEILAPAGSTECIYAAVRCGANAVYLGGTDFSARANATNFDDDALCDAVRYCHLHGVAVHQAINTIAFDSQIEDVLRVARRSAEIGVDAFIIQDLGVLSAIRKALPDMPLHASTQMSIHSLEGVLAAKEMGFSRVVVSREMSLEEIKNVCGKGIEIECFVHGALCMSVSGQCYMSAMIGSRSANRGLCAQACRLPFTAVGDEDYSALSLKDLSYIQRIRELSEIGVTSLKIEGRMKRPEYVAAAVSACREAADGKSANTDNLRAVFSRSGFTDGYLTGNLGRDMFGTRMKEDVVSAEMVFPVLRELYKNEIKSRELSLDIKIKSGEKIVLSGECDGKTFSASGDIPSAAQSKSCDKEQAERQLSKLGDTAFSLKNLTAEIDGGLFVPASLLNDLRRRVTTGLEEKLSVTKRKNTAEKSGDFCGVFNDFKKTRLFVRKAEQLSRIDINDFDAVIPLSEHKKISENFDRFILALPRYTVNEKKISEELSLAREEGFSRVYCNNLSHVHLARRLGMECVCGYGLNVANSGSIDELSRIGVSSCEVSFELKLAQISHLEGKLPRGIIAYGRLPLMLTRNCPISAQVGCKNCTKKLIDRTKREFPVACTNEYAEILNCDILYMADRQSEIRGCDFITLMFSNESAEEVRDVIARYESGAKAPEGITRGLYYRGIL